MTPSEIARVAVEAREALVGARVREVLGTETEALVIGLRAGGRDRRLLISCHPTLARVHLLEAKPEGVRETPFSDLCAARLTGMRLAAIEQPPAERALRLWFGGERREGLSLVAELFGRRPNAILLDASGVVLGAWRTFPRGDRPIAPGVRYRPLPPPKRAVEEGTARSSAEWEAEYAARERDAWVSVLRERVGKTLEKERYRIDGVLRGLEAGLAASARCEEVRKAGEVLKANLDRVPRGAERVTLPDLYAADGGTIDVELDPRMDARANLERIFRRYRRLREAKERLDLRIAAVRTRRDRLMRTIAIAAETTDPMELARIEAEWGKEPVRRTEGRNKERGRGVPRAGVRVFRSADGVEIWVGKGDAENDHLTFRLARGNDLWLHAKDVAGSHVVARIGRREPTEETLLDAAHLAVHYSKARGSGGAEVVYTRVKFVRKSRGARPGQVSLADARTLRVRWEEARMARLAAGGPESGGGER